MIVFILCSLALAILVQNPNPFLPLLTTPAALGIGLTISAVSLLAVYLKKGSAVIWHDVFATGSLLVWYAYWAPQFNDDAPMFFFFPLYYVLLTSVVTLVLINKSQYFDQESIDYLRYLEKNSHLNPAVLMVLVMVSLVFTSHFALYPVAMTLFIIGHTMVACLEIIDS